MKIWIIITQYPPNITAGLGRYAQVMFPAIAASEQVHVGTLNTGNLQRIEERDGLVVHRPVSWVLRLASRRGPINRETRFGFWVFVTAVIEMNLRLLPILWLAHRQDDIDLVAIHDTTNFITLGFVEKVLRRPTVLHVHTTEFGLAPVRSITDPLRLFPRLERHLARRAQLVIAPTPETARVLRDNGWGDREHVRHVVHGSGIVGREINADHSAGRALRHRLGIDEDAPVLVFVGRLHRQKGILPLVRAMRVVANLLPTARLVIVGEGNHDDVYDLTLRLDLEKHVLLTGFVDQEQLADHYLMADLCVFPSIFEPFGLVAVEAMTLGRPCVLGSGFSEVFFGPDDEDPTAIRVNESDIQGFAETLVRWLMDRDQAERVGRSGCDWVATQFSWLRTCRDTVQLYRDVIA